MNFDDTISGPPLRLNTWQLRHQQGMCQTQSVSGIPSLAGNLLDRLWKRRPLPTLSAKQQPVRQDEKVTAPDDKPLPRDTPTRTPSERLRKLATTSPFHQRTPASKWAIGLAVAVAVVLLLLVALAIMSPASKLVQTYGARICQQAGISSTSQSSQAVRERSPRLIKPSGLAQGEPSMSMTLASSAFGDRAMIPKRYTGDGEDLSPPLHWEGVPTQAKQLVLICDDPDAPSREPWVHWVVYGIPVTTRSLPEGLPPRERLASPIIAMQGQNSWSHGTTVGYRGPMPPAGHGKHHYRFRLYALAQAVKWELGLTKADVLQRMEGQIVAEAELVGIYER